MLMSGSSMCLGGKVLWVVVGKQKETCPDCGAGEEDGCILVGRVGIVVLLCGG